MSNLDPEVLDDNPEAVAVEVVLALPQRQQVVSLTLPPGSTIEAAIEQSGLDFNGAGITVSDENVGVFGQPRRLQEEVRAGDRVEVYRPLLIDPKQARRLRAQSQG